MSARFREGGAPARRVKRECLAQAGLEQPGRQQPAQPAQELLGRSAVACGRALRSIATLPRRRPSARAPIGTMGDHCRGQVALRRIKCGSIKTARMPNARTSWSSALRKRRVGSTTRFRQPFDSVLGARINAHERRRHEAPDRADIDDQARALTPHAWEHGLDHAQDADDVGVEQCLRLADARFLDGTDQIDAGIEPVSCALRRTGIAHLPGASRTQSLPRLAGSHSEPGGNNPLIELEVRP